MLPKAKYHWSPGFNAGRDAGAERGEPVLAA